MPEDKPPDPNSEDTIPLLRSDHENLVRSSRSAHTGTDWIPPTPAELDAELPAFEVRQLIGRGGMGAVYRATQVSLDRQVAIKVLPPEFATNPSFADRFRREAHALAGLNHPNVVHIHDFGKTDAGHFYFVMEFVEGADFHQLIRAGQLTPAMTLNAVSQICDALAYAHGKGYIHRDIKPANIFLSDDGHVKVGDFGLAKLIHPGGGDGKISEPFETVSGTVMGTPQYMAPEAISGDGQIDPRTDIYSLGVMFYEMLTGQVPRGHFDPPSKKVEIDTRIDDVVLKAMAEEPGNRYQTATEVQTDVDLIRATPSPSDDTSRAASTRRSKKRIRMVAGAAGLVLLTLTAVLSNRSTTGPAFSPETPSIGRNFSNSNGQRLIWIEAGTFFMGSSTEEQEKILKVPGGRSSNARDERRHEVTLTRGYWMGEFEVTVGEYLRFLTESGQWKEHWVVVGDGINRSPIEKKGSRFEMRDGRGPTWGDLRQPMVCVSWEGAMAYCAWLNEVEGANLPENYEYSLPTEAEWEYACRAGTQTMTYVGDTTILAPYHAPELDSIAWYGGNSGVDYPEGWDSSRWLGKQYDHQRAASHPVGQKAPNLWGLHDTLGNAWEWCRDLYDAEYDQDKQTDPQGPGPEVSSATFVRCLRGGAWKSVSPYLRAANRNGKRYDYGDAETGFRLALNPIAAGPAEPSIPFSGPGGNFTNGEDSPMIWIEPGTFQMGARDEDLETVQTTPAGGKSDFLQKYRDKLKKGPVKIESGFWMGKHEVTIGQFVQFLNASSSVEHDWIDLASYAFSPVEYSGDQFRMRPGRGPTWGDKRQPIAMVSWKGAMAYCEWLNRSRSAAVPAEFHYTLPTESQWEYACRAGTKTMTYSGDLTFIDERHVPELDTIAWYMGNSGVEYLEGFDSSVWTGKHYDHKRAATHPVGLKSPNAWGLHDMLGNVWEWCLDRDDFGSGYGRMLRGGSWDAPGRSNWAAFRSYPQPETKAEYGFRIVLTEVE